MLARSPGRELSNVGDARQRRRARPGLAEAVSPRDRHQPRRPAPHPRAEAARRQPAPIARPELPHPPAEALLGEMALTQLDDPRHHLPADVCTAVDLSRGQLLWI